MPVSEYINAIILGALQGVAEFLPISSSGHLVIFGKLLGQTENFQMTVALHVGTLFSILVVYRNELKILLTKRPLCQAIVLATVPLVAIGLCLSMSKPIKSMLDALFSNVLLAGCGLLVTAVVLVVGQRLERNRRTLDEITTWHAIIVGLFQAMALVPGVSRSGSTIAGGLVGGLRREAATTFSFFIAIPAIAGGGVLAAKEIWEGNGGGSSVGVLLVGASVSFVVGLFALRWLIRLVSQQRLHWFAWYCAVVGTATILWQLWRQITVSS
ncbi:MAG: undecaprenyl-diphosphate phosphatase [Planctomycetaceae bacterium]|jgi:undecaprenyl-diphosphatase|nr:undecaprenyl-diphosphate phosphatase [Planctomycetaceae bacterium]MBT6156572.1 undecaprenyl-diphosphate phosphatase [Planctomycetaceae bacterium]MBT6483827.1 undecaprenyl-diphosphate phosphatase [Planctomycetaceae bacterium]MBT6496707.1 undecaprenyl-diphosphate phosphatase [Planctomycetaceae bacterium]